MPTNNDEDRREHDLMVVIFSVAAGLIGVCLTGIGLLRVVVSIRGVDTWCDEMLSLDSVAFLATCGLAFVSFRLESAERRRAFRRSADICFVIGLSVMAIVCVMVTLAVI